MGETQRIGSNLFWFGFVVFFVGLVTASPRILVSSNIQIFLGLLLSNGFQQFFKYLFKFERLKGTILFIIGLALVIMKITLPGVICELVGGYWLFGGFIPLVLSFLSKVPIISWLVPSSMRKEDLD